MEQPPGFVPAFGPGETKIESPPWLPAGWHAVERPRETGTHADRFYYTPDAGVRLRSKPEVERYLAGKPTLESLAKGVPRPPPAPPSCPVEEVRPARTRLAVAPLLRGCGAPPMRRCAALTSRAAVLPPTRR